MLESDILILLSTLHERYDLSPADRELVSEACKRLKNQPIDWVEVIILMAKLLIAGSTMQ
jgi:hypothetical protein